MQYVVPGGRAVKLHEFLGGVHSRLRPRTYLEIGVATGLSLAQSRTRTIGVDPGFKISEEIACDVQLNLVPSDDFFARDNPMAWFRGKPIDLAFIDGMHLFEFALRDFMNVEKHAHPGSVIIFDDILARNPTEAARERVTGCWTGDVFKIIPTLHEYRPDLTVIPVDTWPTGVLVVIGADPTNPTLRDNYDAILAKYRTPDPQPLPESLMRRQCTLKPEKVLGARFWHLLRRQRPLPGRLKARNVRRAVEGGLPNFTTKVLPAYDAMVRDASAAPQPQP
jgi:hypothetical protein